MALQYTANIQIAAGTDFYQEFHLTEQDLSPLDISDMTFAASMRKHANSKNVLESSGAADAGIQFETSVVDGKLGIYSISLPRAKTLEIEEGKYVFNVIMKTLNEEEFIDTLSGLVFVDKSFGVLYNLETDV